MKKIKLKLMLLLGGIMPFLLIAQESENAIRAVNVNGGIIAQLAHLLPMGINPYATVFFTSVLSKMGIHNDFVATNPFFDNWTILIIFGSLFLFTTLVGTVFKTNKATAVIGLADNYLSNHAAVLINIIVMLAPVLFLSENQSTVQEAGVISFSFKTILILIVSVYFLIVITTFRFFIDILIFLTPIPFIDSILEITKLVLTVVFIGFSIFFPALSVVLSLLFFITAIVMYKKSLRLVSKTTYLFIYPIINMSKTKDRLLTVNNNFSILVYLNEGIKSIKKGTIARLEEREDGFYLVKRRFFISKKEEKIDFTDAIFTQGSLKSKIVDENINLTLFLNRSYHRYMQEIANKMGAKKQLDNEILALGSGNGFISNVKNMFNEKDVEELKFIE